MITCSNCGGEIIGDGFNMVRHCEYAEVDISFPPDSELVLCVFVPEPKPRFLDRVKKAFNIGKK